MRKAIILLLLAILINGCAGPKAQWRYSPRASKTKEEINKDIYDCRMAAALNTLEKNDSFGTFTDIEYRKCMDLKYGYVKALAPDKYIYAYTKIRDPIEGRPGKFAEGETFERCFDWESCAQYLESFTSENAITDSKKCIPANTRITKVFNNKPVGNWYIHLVNFKAGALFTETVVVCLDSVDCAKEMKATYVSMDYLKRPKSKINKNTVFIVSPNGKVERKNY